MTKDYLCGNCGHTHLGRCTICDSQGKDCDGVYLDAHYEQDDATTPWKAYPEAGAYYRLRLGALIFSPMRMDGGHDPEEWGAVDESVIDEEEIKGAREIEQDLRRTFLGASNAS